MRKNSTEVRLLLLAVPSALRPSKERLRHRDTTSLSLPETWERVNMEHCSDITCHSLTARKAVITGLAAVLQPAKVHVAKGVSW